MGQETIYFGRFISTPKPEELLIRTGAVLVNKKNGRGVIERADWTVNGPNDAISKFGVEAPVVTTKENGFFFPGFIDTHIHASQYPNVGIFGKSTLLDWLTTYTFPLESSLGNTNSPMYKDATEPPNPLARAKAVYNRIISRTLANGTTTASYYATIHLDATNLLADLAFDKGQRAYIGRVCMDRPETCPDYYRDESSEETLTNTKASIEYCRSLDPSGELLAHIITPRFAPSCLSETLSKLGSLAKEEDIRVQTHISENLNEVQLVKELFPDQATYTDVYDHHGLLTPRTILAHAVHLSQEEMRLIKERKTKVSHCPASNSALGSGFCPVRVMLDEGVEVGLGTDVSGGYSPSILDAVRNACIVSRHVGFINGGDSRYNLGVAEGLWLATVGGAKVVGMEGRLGGFEEGMLWDVQEIIMGDVSSSGDGEETGVDIFGWEQWDDRVAKWVWNGDDRNVQRVWVGGRLVHERRS
ncbi:guanine deaminase [Rhinocladiella mackenziei CBS 650.93]|uniref:Probable guanine deaminase n=1 Tax=Rhinocladiella mackenziei CBS 650.93 TaxID=1442369 RepID=A0A0D2IN22_9EURO|nr:guanine deaminase [Rhinocladiella mackenziei CBS 650.93]KIX07224.1 guanine deaminase [Rhinocladiella mackenziei CBS 650.93]